MWSRRWIAGVLFCATAPAWSAAASVQTDPADPKAVVAPLAYKSVFEGYRRHTDARIASWKEANDEVGRIGGWRVYLKEAHQPDPPAAAPRPRSMPSAPVQPTVPADHRGHRARH